MMNCNIQNNGVERSLLKIGVGVGYVIGILDLCARKVYAFLIMLSI